MFKELIVSLQQSSELLESIQNQLRAKKTTSERKTEMLKQEILQLPKPPPLQKSWLEEPPMRAYPPSSVLMPSATSADAFYTLANAAVRQHHLQVCRNRAVHNSTRLAVLPLVHYQF